MDSLFTGLHQHKRGVSLVPWRQASFWHTRTPAQLLPLLDQKPLLPLGPTTIKPRHQPWLAAALNDLNECIEEAREEGYPEPTSKALSAAEGILQRIGRLKMKIPRPNVYPTEDNEIDLFFRRGDVGAAVLVLIDADGGGACFSNVGGLRRARHEEVDDLMIETIELELRRLSRLAAPS